jgi:sterol desaturase/sphingolipid hydroxylase (fatty acid hydroxylase superfamily)
MKILSTTSQWKQAVSEWRGIGDAPAKSNRPYRFGFKVLEDDFLEKYVATAHWTLPGLWAIPAVIYLLYRSANSAGHEPASIVWLFLAGILGWTFVEYWLHRWVFHAAPSRNKVLRTVQFMLHGYHHEFPDDPGRLVAPPVMAVPIFVILTSLVILCFPQNWPAILAGTFFGYLCYDWVHYYTHHGRHRSALGKFMRRFHMEHHYKNANSQFGLSSPLWDVIFLTYRRPTSPARVEQACLERDGPHPGGSL